MTAELWTQLVGGVIFFITVSGALWGIWWRIEGKVDTARRDALERVEAARKEAAERVDVARKEASERASVAILEASNARIDLAAHRLYCAESFITKAGMRESTELIMEALQGVKQAVDHMALRVDRVVENQANKPRARTT
jgi:hypothetical protein